MEPPLLSVSITLISVNQELGKWTEIFLIPRALIQNHELPGAVLTSKYKYLNNINSNCFQLKLSGGNSNRKQMVTHFKHFKLSRFNGDYIIPWKTPRVLESTEQFLWSTIIIGLMNQHEIKTVLLCFALAVPVHLWWENMITWDSHSFFFPCVLNCDLRRASTAGTMKSCVKYLICSKH